MLLGAKLQATRPAGSSGIVRPGQPLEQQGRTLADISKLNIFLNAMRKYCHEFQTA
jgi:hypothetical protein